MYARTTTWRDWVAVTALGIGSFTIVTAAYSGERDRSFRAS